MVTRTKTKQALIIEVEDLRARLEQAESALNNSRNGNTETTPAHDASSQDFWRAGSPHLTLLSQISDAVIAVDNDQCVIYLNAAAERQYGVTAAEAMGCKLESLYQYQWLTPDDEAAAFAELREHGVWRGTNIHVRRDGQSMHVESIVSTLRDDAGKAIGLLAVIRDMTTQREAEARVQQSEAHLRRVLDNLFAFVGMMLPDGTLIEANRAPLEAAGIALSDVIGRKFWDCYWWNYSAEVQAQLRDAVERANHGEVVRYDVPVRMAGDTRMWIDFQLSPLRDEAGRITHLIPSAMEIDERKRVEEALRQSEDRFRLALLAVQSIIYDWDINTDHVNRSYELTRLLGFANDEAGVATNAWYRSRLHPDDAEAAIRRVENAIASGAERFEDEFRLQHKDGHYLWVRDSGLLIRDQMGKVVRCVGSITNVTDQRRALEALRESENRLSLAIESGRMGAWEWDLLTGIEYWSPEQERLFGLTPGTGIYQADQFFKMVHPEDQNRIDAEANIASAADQDYIEDEFRIIKPDGTVAWIASRSRLHRDASGRVVRVSGVNMDVTDRKRAEDALRESELRFRRLTEANIIGMVTANLDAVLSSNEVFLRMIGYSLEDLNANRIDWQAMTPREYAALDQKALAQLVELGWSDPYEKEFIRKDGTRISVLVGGALLTREPLTWISFIVDLSERKQIEAKLQSANYRFRVAEEAANSFSYDWNLATGVIERSAGLQSVLGYAPGEVASTYAAWAGLVHPDDYSPESEAQAIYSLKHSVADSLGFEYRARHKNGQYRWLYERGVLLRDARGEVQHVIGQTVDITERKETEEALRASEARYRELNAKLEMRVAERTEELARSREQLRELSAYIVRTREDERARIAREVHDELGGSLTVLKMSLARAARGREDDAALSAQVNDMRAQIDNLVKLVRRIASDLRPSILDDFGLAAAMEWQAQEWGERTGIPCRLDVSLVPENLEIDSKRRTALFRVFQESLTNVARHAHASFVAATLMMEDEQLVLTIQDNGQGMNTEMPQAGKSMGLLGMRERIREVGGNCEIISAIGKGTTVCVRVPLTSD